MKKIILFSVIGFLLSGLTAFSQSDTIHSVFKEGKRITFFTGPFSRNKLFDNSKFVSNFGGGGGIYINHKYYVYLQTTSFTLENDNNDSERFIMNMLGVSAGYNFNPAAKVHLVAGTQIYHSSIINDEDVNPIATELKYLLVSPEIYVEVNLLPYVRFYAGPSYYFAVGNDSYSWIDSNYLNGISLNAGLLVGKF